VLPIRYQPFLTHLSSPVICPRKQPQETSSVNPSSLHIAIAGAGLLGRLLAWRLAVAGHHISVFEAGSLLQPPQGQRAAAFTAAGMVAPLSEAVVSDADVYRMGLYALQRWPEWLAGLPPQETPLFHYQGSLVVAHPQDYPELDQFEQELRFVIPECRGYQRLDGVAIQQLEPDLNPGLQQGLFLAEEGHIHNRELMQQLGVELQRLGVAIHERTAVAVAPYRVHSQERQWQADCVIDCRGLGAKPQMPAQALRGVRGETLHVETREIHLQRPVRLMHPRYQLYAVPKPNHRFIIGATQIESEDSSPVSIQSSLELSSALYTLSPAFAEARIIELDTNLRPAFMDNMPRVIQQPGLITANGLFRHGYLLAPAVVDNVLALVHEQKDVPFSHPLNRVL